MGKNTPIAANLKKKKVLITGGLGFIGSNLAHRCLELGAAVIIYDCLDSRSGGNMFNVQDIKKEVNILLKDIRNFDDVSRYIKGQDILFNCAAYTSHPNSMKEPLIDIDVNCKGVINILEASRRLNPGIKIVQVGASTQVGRMVQSPIDELHPEFPMDIYSANKCVSEKYMLIYSHVYKMHTVVIRLANIFGPRSNVKSPDFGFINYFIGLALQGKDLTVYGDGRQLRNVSYVEDCVEALILASKSPDTDEEVFFAVSDRQYTIAEIAQAITEHIGGKVRFMEWPNERKAIEFGDAVISNQKIKDKLHWVPRYDLVTGLTKTREYFRSCLDKYL